MDILSHRGTFLITVLYKINFKDSFGNLDLYQGMVSPCVMDVKIGAKTYGPDATCAKKQQEDAKYLGTKKPLGRDHVKCLMGNGCLWKSSNTMISPLPYIKRSRKVGIEQVTCYFFYLVQTKMVLKFKVIRFFIKHTWRQQ